MAVSQDSGLLPTGPLGPVGSPERAQRRFWPSGDRGRLLALAPLLLLVALPLVMLLVSWARVDEATWQHLSTWLLPRLIGHSLLLMGCVGAGVAVLGVGLAWLSACCEYPGRRWLDPLLILPLAFPTYVLAFIYLGLTDFAGPLQSGLRETFGSSPALLEWLSGPSGVIPIMILAFYPYVYLLARASFASGGLVAFEAGRSLGASPLRVFLRVSLPAARPAIVAGLALALMETLADFGAVSIYGFDTFTTAIYRTWLGLFDLRAATQLASLLMLFMLVLVFSERLTRRSRSRVTERRPNPNRIPLSGARAWAATAFQAGVIAVAVVVPLIQLLAWAAPELGKLADAAYLRVIGNTVMLGAIGATVTTAAGLLLLLATYRAPRRIGALGELAAVGYAIPGTVLAVALMLALTGLDNLLGTALAGGLLTLILAYVIRFVRVAWGPLEGVAARIRPEYFEIAKSLGAPRLERLRRVMLPLLRPGLVTAFLLGLVEIAKEMPATLMLRPFGWDTLAVRIYELTVEGQWERAALPALVLVVLGAIPAVLLMRRASRPGGG
ncbi:MAG: iron ABC transporter permease [Wenzhouxiangellaceae bacterium]|nr:iron ABC transporter permease [Wenzhouxiangellaceae bacterium]